MKRSIKIAVAAAMALSATSAFATNGDHLIGMGAKARGMGGIGIGMSHGAESALSNPALITSVKGTEISFGGTVFMPDVEADMALGEGSYKSDADLSVIPEVAIAQNAGNGIYWGIGMFGVAGMGTDYRSASTNNAAIAGNYVMSTNLQLMQFAVPLAYTTDGLSLGIAPVLQYGSLDINYDANTAAAAGNSDTKGVAQDFGFGYNIGLAYETQGLTLGASYKSAIDMVYKGQLSEATRDFNYKAATGFLDDHLEQPAEIGVGASYTMGGHTFAADYKKIKWGSAKGYKDFGWEDQNVYILGYQFAQDNWALRAGYNHAKSPIKEQNGGTGTGTYANYDGAVANMFNMIGFPGIVENHYTVGGSYAFSKMTSLDLAYVYSPEVTETFNIADYADADARIANTVTTKHSQDAVSFQLNFNF